MYAWDVVKSAKNKLKHGISFEEARDHIFEKENLVISDVARSFGGEERFAVLGKFKGKYYAGIFAIRPDGIRIISVRRARREEEKEAKNRGF